MGLKSFAARLLMLPDATVYWRHREKYARARTGLARMWHSIRCQRICQQLGASIPVITKIEGRIDFPHGLAGIFISKDAQIGTGCTILQQVTIGSNTLPDSKHSGAPVIGNNVYIGAGAKIIGGITIGDGVRIGANCVVFEDIPPHTTVVLPKPRLIVRKDTPS